MATEILPKDIEYEEQKKVEIHREVVFANEKPRIIKNKEELKEEEEIYLRENQEINDEISDNNENDQRKIPDERNAAEEQREDEEINNNFKSQIMKLIKSMKMSSDVMN